MLCTLLLLGGLVLGQAEAAPADDLGPQVRRLVRQLDDSSLANRAAAEQALIDLGPAALQLLPPVTANMSAEVKVRLDRVRGALQQAASKAAADPSRVTLRGEMLLSEALAAVQKQTGNRIVDFRERFNQQKTDPKVATDFDNCPFWEAFDQLLDRAGVTVYNFSGEEGAVAIVSRGPGEQPRARRGTYAGLFRFEGMSVLARRDLRNPENHSLRLQLEVAWEPRVSPIVLQVPLDTVQAVDEAGQAVSLEGQPTRLEVPVEAGIPAAELQVPFALPPRSVQKIASLKATLLALVPGKVETFEFAEVESDKAVERRTAGVTVTLEQIRKNVDVYEARVRVRFEQAANALESHRGWVYNNEAYLLDPQGQRVDHVGMQATLQREDEVGVAYLFDREQGVKGCKFVYKTPTTIVQLPVEYELKDIELP